ncbi:MAG: response regulator, partial [Rhodobacterales bacterium]|nr:response regulator [Rhodobacterales bacterium]
GDADLVLMDISMPRKDGISATHDIRRAEAACGVAPIPIIALTGNATAEDRARCMAAGMNGFLTKPLRKATVLAELARFLPENTPPRQAGAPPRGAA